MRLGAIALAETLHPEEAVTTFLLIRHGHTIQTEAGKLYSDPASTLTDKGREEAKAIAGWLPREEPKVLLSSPSVRARATAGAISDICRLPVQLVESLREWQVGQWEGRSYLEIKKAEPDVYGAWAVDPIRNAPPGGESIEQLCARALVDLEALRQEYPGERVAMVTHSEVIRAILVNALGMPIDNFWRINIPTASVSKLDLSPSFATVHYMSVSPR
ncbi:MAG TPA: histidine phosphatase family protein [Candidatus Obscuribacterales bacterium]